MPCVHLQKLYQLCVDQDIKLSGSDLIHMVCEQCGIQEACPSLLMEEYDQQQDNEQKREAQLSDSAGQGKPKQAP